MFNKTIFISLCFSILLSVSFAQDQDKNEQPPDFFIPTELLQNQVQDGGVRTEPAKFQSLQQVQEPQAISSTGQQNKISLDIKGMDIVDVLKMLSARTGMNIVIGKNVSGRVTLFIKDVDINDALELIILSNDLAYEKAGNIINVMTQRDYELEYGQRYKDKKQVKSVNLKYARAIDVSQALNQIKTNIGRVIVDEASNTIILIDVPETVKSMEEFITQIDTPTETRIFDLNYAQAEKLMPKIQENISKGIGSVKIDERTNKVVITDYPHKLDDVTKLISAFDERGRQVLIDAQIIEVNPDSDKLEMGIDFDYWLKKHFRLSAALPVNTSTTLLLGTIGSTVAKVGDYKAVLDILRTIGETKTLASPRIMVMNNQEAKILLGTKDAYITSTTSQASGSTTVTSQSVNFVDVGIKLFVTPTISKDGFVTMKIKPEISSSDRVDLKSEGQVTQVPIVTTSEAETTVMVKDGITVIIGGLKKDKREKSVKQIPIMADLPFIGNFFKRTSDQITKTDLVILLTPHVISGENTFSDFSEIKPKDGARAKMDKKGISIERISSNRQVSNYYDKIKDKLKTAADFLYPGEEKGIVKLTFSINENGILSTEPYVLESNNDTLTPIAIQTVKIASPFPPPPKEIKGGNTTFNIELSYK